MPELFEQARRAFECVQVTLYHPVEVADVPGDEVGDSAILEAAPDELHRVQVRCISRESLQVQTRKVRTHGADQRPFVVSAHIPDDDDRKVTWWALRNERLLEQVNVPLTNSRDDWAETCTDLAKLVVEGFETKALRLKLDAGKVPYSKEDRTIALLEKLLDQAGDAEEEGKLTGMRTVQSLRSKAKGHASGREAQELAEAALMEHGTFANHFEQACTQVADELEGIEQRLS